MSTLINDIIDYLQSNVVAWKLSSIVDYDLELTVKNIDIDISKVDYWEDVYKELHKVNNSFLGISVYDDKIELGLYLSDAEDEMVNHLCDEGYPYRKGQMDLISFRFLFNNIQELKEFLNNHFWNQSFGSLY